MYRPKKPFNAQFMILVPAIKNVNGKVVYVYPDTGDIINAAYTTFGGTESVVNGVYSVAPLRRGTGLTLHQPRG